MDIVLILSIFKELTEHRNFIATRKLLLQRKRSELETIVERNKRLALWLLSKNKKRRTRSCWVRPEFLNPEHGNYWESTVSLYSDKLLCSMVLLHAITMS